MVFERRNVVFNILIDEKTQKNILIMDLMGKRQAPNKRLCLSVRPSVKDEKTPGKV